MAVLGSVAVAWVLWEKLGATPRGGQPTGAEGVFLLSAVEDTETYGDGPEVTRRCPNACRFEFRFTPPNGKRVLATLNYFAKGVVHPGDVRITLNGAAIASLPATLTFDRRFSVHLKAASLKRDAENRIVFEGSQSASDRRPWAISGLSVETTELPPCAREDCLREARLLAGRCSAGQRTLLKDKGSAFSEMQECKRALLLFEAVDEDTPEVTQPLQETIWAVQEQLAGECSEQVAAGKRLLEVGSPDLAVAQWKKGIGLFPFPAHPCYRELKSLIGKYEPNSSIIVP